MRFFHQIEGENTEVRFDLEEILIGRAEGDHQPDLEIADPSVSRRHARVWMQDGVYWIEDLNSTAGTSLNGKSLTGISTLAPGDELGVGRVRIIFAGADADKSPRMVDIAPGDRESSANASHPTAGETTEEDLHLSDFLIASDHHVPDLQDADTKLRNRLKMLFDLPLQFAGASDPQELFQLILNKVIELIPGATRGALLVIDPIFNKLAVRASIPEDDPPISRTLVKRTVSHGGGFIWSRTEEVDVTQSVRDLGMQSGMYAPLVWKDDVLGVVCIDSPHASSCFTDTDLKFLMSVAHYAAAAVANHQLQKDLEEKSTVMERLLTNFSPRLRGKLLDKARHDRLKPGGEKSDVTLLMSDIRGFTKLTADMDAGFVVEMLNEYFSALVETIFEHQGTIDKFIGDAILAVFGSPEPDDRQHENAVRAALAMQDAMKQVNESRRKRGAVTCELGIGLHHGEVLHGFIGAENRLEFTVIGDTVNRTARYCDGAAPGEILLSSELHACVADQFETRPKTIPTKHEGDFQGQLIIRQDG